MTAENKEQGFIKLYRSMFQWEWWDDINTFRLFATILMMANWKSKKWHNQDIPRGSFWTSLKTLSQKSGLSIQEVRTSLSKLKSTNELTIKSTKRGRLITVVNYDFYQDDDRKATNTSTNKLTDNQQTINKQSTITKEVKESKELKNVIVVGHDDQEIWKRLSESDIDRIYKLYPETGGILIDAGAREVKENRRRVEKPVPYILSYAKRVGWDDKADQFREPWFE